MRETTTKGNEMENTAQRLNRYRIRVGNNEYVVDALDLAGLRERADQMFIKGVRYEIIAIEGRGGCFSH